MEVTYELNNDDVSQLFRYIRSHRSQIKIRPAFLYAGLGVAAFVAVSGLFVSLVDYRHAQGDPPWFAFLMTLLGIYWVVHWMVVRPLRAVREAQRNPQVMGRKTMKISAEGIFVKHSLGEVTMHWPLFVDLVDDRDCYYFFLEKNNVLAVPKRAFVSQSQAQTFYETAKRDWQAAKHLAARNQEADPATWPPPPSIAPRQEPDVPA